MRRFVAACGVLALAMVGSFASVRSSTVATAAVRASGGPPGAVTTFPSSIGYPGGIAVGSDGALWFANWGNNSIGRITATGSVSSYRDANTI